MGYEVIYHYKEATETPGSYSEEVLTKTSKIGKFEEEISLEVLAGKIMAQLARRNILIINIEIFEYTKKKISYKESNDGIVIKNKKFSFDSGAVVSAESEEDEELSKILEDENLLSKLKSALGTNKPLVNIANKNVAQNSENRKILRHEIYDPELLTSHKMQQKGFKLTVGKRYPIFSEKKGVGVMNYITKDDSGREIEVSAECFVAPSLGLSFQDDQPQYVGAANEEVNLWKNVQVENNMPDIRGR